MKERDPNKMGWFVRTLCRLFPHKELGWTDIDEVFFRWTLFNTPWFKVVLHRLDAETWHNDCHDHPWDFLAILLWGGYYEKLDSKQEIRSIGRRVAKSIWWRRPGSILHRPAETRHNVTTKPGQPSWSVVVMGKKKRGWGFMPCE